MTLKETLKNAINYQLIFGLDKIDNKIERAADNCEKIADDYAIEFYKWMIDNIHIFHELSIWNKEHKKYSEKEILEIFKKEKGL
jgi:23S rRNA G2445 N2-methylase RlmL